MKKTSVFILLFLLSADVFSQNSHKHLIIDGIKAKVRASSELSSRRSPDAYSVLNAFDNDTATAWVEGSKGNGAGEWIEVWFEHPVLFKNITIVNGYRKSSLLFAQNNRMAAFDIRFDSDKSPLFSNKQIDTTIMLQVNRVATKIRFVITNVTAGTKYSDLCISDIVLGVEKVDTTTASGNLIKGKKWLYLCKKRKN
ncbi:MAG: discoidin domain-containing protein [Chitinispirillaceae bacterium]